MNSIISSFFLGKDISYDVLSWNLHGTETMSRPQSEARAGALTWDPFRATNRLQITNNPPYMGASGMGTRLTQYVKDNYPDSKNDLFAVFVEKCWNFSKANTFYSLIVQPSVLSLGAFERLRMKLIHTQTIYSLLHMGRGVFGIDFGSTSFCMQNASCDHYIGKYFRLHERTFQYVDPNDIAQLFLNGKEYERYAFDFSNYSQGIDSKPNYEGTRISYSIPQKYFDYIPSSPLSAFTFSKNVIVAFAQGKLLGNIGKASEGVKTGNNEKYLRMWHEIDAGKFKEFSPNTYKWVSHHKGGDFRKWYGNLDWVINWENDAFELKAEKNSGFQGKDMYFSEVICWSKIASVGTSFRLIPEGGVFDSGSPAFVSKDHLLYYLAFLNSSLAKFFLKIKNPTINCQVGDVKSLPIVPDSEILQVEEAAKRCVTIAKESWDNNERSWNFDKPLLLKYNKTIIEDSFNEAVQNMQNHYETLKKQEEWINKHFLNLYHAEGQAEVEVTEEELSAVCKIYDCRHEIGSLISFAVGCMFGRYSLDVDGLVYAGGSWEDHFKRNVIADEDGNAIVFRDTRIAADNGYQIKTPDGWKDCTFSPDPDNCIPITDEPYFEDDIVGRFVDFVRVVYGADTLEENLTFITNALGTKGTSSREVIRNYFLNDFFKDHCSTYSVTGSGKRPIYWLFDSGKQNGFKALVYMHRWNADTIGNVRVEYLHRMQKVYEKEIERMQDVIDNSRDNREVAQAAKRREKLIKQLKETQDYDAKIAHAALARVDIDLDDGVKVNYEKVQKGPDGKSLGILAKI